MNTTKSVYEIAILARATWNLHSLNNEGHIGNVIEPRTLKLADGSVSDGISGEMLKHIHVENIWALQADKSKFCEGCQKIDPTRAEQNKQVRNAAGIQAMTNALSDCILCDLHGFLVQKPTIHRDSTIQFGWAATLRDKYERDIHQHARHAVGEVEKEQETKSIGKGDGSKVEFSLDKPPLEGTFKVYIDGAEKKKEDDYILDSEGKKIKFKIPPSKGEKIAASYSYSSSSQMLFSRPTRSGVYAIVTVLQPWRIGLNSLNYKYAVSSEERIERYKLALKAYQTMFWRTDGSMTSTRLPHLEAFEGVIAVSSKNLPVPVISPLKENYRDELKLLGSWQDEKNVKEEEFEYLEFDDLPKFVTLIRELTQRTPYGIEAAGSGRNGK